MKTQKLINRIVCEPNIMLGKPVVKGTRLTVELIIEKIAYGATFEDLMRDYPFLVEEDIRASLLYAAKQLANEDIYTA
jgi:uncharacterized protein (DUF433 family)